ncbi:MAG: hypothetical protein M1477_05725 [Candidatus Thermoplasmatota archaeon]|nr:hypothetical protein [Candidatus Thermoplasmatota archaeon]
MVNYAFIGFIALLGFTAFIFVAYYYPEALGLKKSESSSNTIDPTNTSKTIFWRGE